MTEKQSENLLLCVTAVMGPLRRNFDEFSRRWGKGVLINFDLEFHIVVLVHQKAYFVASLIFFLQGFPESVVAASLSRVGLKVLHLDRSVTDTQTCFLDPNTELNLVLS